MTYPVDLWKADPDMTTVASAAIEREVYLLGLQHLLARTGAQDRKDAYELMLKYLMSFKPAPGFAEAIGTAVAKQNVRTVIGQVQRNFP